MFPLFFCSAVVLLDILIVEAQGQCRNLRFTIDPIHGQRLENHVIRTIITTNKEICQLQCFMEPNCVSYNFNKKEEANGEHKCDLNNATYERDNQHSGDLAKNENYVYRGAENACAKKPCQNNSTCLAGFTDRDYKCLCINGFTGHDCQNGSLLECRDPLGMESRAISDAQISASSEWNPNHAAIQGRLNFQAGGGKIGAWSAKYNDQNQWLRVDLGSSKHVTRLATQGRNSNRFDQWITSYKVEYSSDGSSFHCYHEHGTDKIFTANSDRDTIVYNTLSPPITARYIRIVPRTFFAHISMRMEIYGC